MMVKLNHEVLYRGRIYKPGELVPAEDAMVELWKENGFLADADMPEIAESEPEQEPECEAAVQAERLTALAPPGLVEGGSGSEGFMPGRDSRKKRVP